MTARTGHRTADGAARDGSRGAGSGSDARRRGTVRAGADDRNRQARGDARRQQILAAAVDLFAARGYRGTGLAALGKRVGMTPTGLLYYFGTKERLLREVVAERERTDGHDSPPFEELSLATLGEIGRHNVETAVFTRLYVVLGAENLDPGDPLHEFFVQRYADARGIAVAVLTAEQERGAVRDDIDVAQIAREIVATLMGLEIQWLTDPGSVDLAASTEAYFDRLAHDLAPGHRASTTSTGGPT